MERPLLFAECPALERGVQWTSLGDYPTPVEKLEGLCRSEGISDLYVKRDDLSSPHYGGNKVRKLEYLLARARALGHDVAITFGAAGSNHVLATVIHGERVGVRTIAVLMPQPNAAYVRKNLLLDYLRGAELVVARSVATMPLAFARGMMAGYDREKRMFPFVIPPGGTNLPGCLGYVNAALEIKQQVDEGLLPEPEFIFVTYGSGGTAAGLVVGAQLAGLSSRVVPVRVVEKVACNRRLLAWHINRTARFLKRNCPVANLRGVRPGDITLIDNFAGRHYARFTEEGMDAVDKARRYDGIKLEGTYTGKTLAGALDFIKREGLSERTSLFWNTYNSADLYPPVADIDYHLLPPELHRYFTSPLQEEEMGHEVVY
ncbi:MAG: pyridoxal-phosphate dependent enzyme [Actinomycetia bacterium]|nr:pyridoxal-phosphate dependent enzyme [Actinomycetes bacterium]